MSCWRCGRRGKGVGSFTSSGTRMRWKCLIPFFLNAFYFLALFIDLYTPLRVAGTSIVVLSYRAEAGRLHQSPISGRNVRKMDGTHFCHGRPILFLPCALKTFPLAYISLAKQREKIPWSLRSCIETYNFKVLLTVCPYFSETLCSPLELCAYPMA